ncbi:hypothetical protein P692DRAFT_201879122 [Suillus brevipes Sb2]|nr:hypothetical protein P692DRAFT_201879122 [Suillus brevipes Sb2]
MKPANVPLAQVVIKCQCYPTSTHPSNPTSSATRLFRCGSHTNFDEPIELQQRPGPSTSPHPRPPVVEVPALDDKKALYTARRPETASEMAKRIKNPKWWSCPNSFIDFAQLAFELIVINHQTPLHPNGPASLEHSPPYWECCIGWTAGVTTLFIIDRLQGDVLTVKLWDVETGKVVVWI